MRSLLKRMCNTATARARKLGFDVDFEKGLYISSGRNVWFLHCALEDNNFISFMSNDGNVIGLGAKFMSYVPAIDRFSGIPVHELQKSPVGRLYIYRVHGDDSVLIPLVDEFAYKLPDIAVEMVLYKFMDNASFAMFENKNKHIVLEKVRKSVAAYTAELKGIRKCYRGIEFLKKSQALCAKYNTEQNELLKSAEPIKVPVVPKPCKSLEELGIILDCYDAA